MLIFCIGRIEINLKARNDIFSDAFQFTHDYDSEGEEDKT